MGRMELADQHFSSQMDGGSIIHPSKKINISLLRWMEAPSSIMEQLASNKGRLAMAAALGTGVVLGAAGLVVYQVSYS